MGFGNGQEQLVHFFKSLADESRLKMLIMLAQKEYNVGELATTLELTEPTVSHHLNKLRIVGLVSLRADGNQRFYRINAGRLSQLKVLVNNLENLPLENLKEESDNTWMDALDLTKDERKVLIDYTFNGQLKQIPSTQKKLQVVLKWLSTKFLSQEMYTERQVNEIISKIHPDYATLRRDLVDFGFLRRERGGGKYWLTPENEKA